MSRFQKTIALTIGDPNGIGPEIAVKAAAEMSGRADICIVLVGDEHVIRHYSGRHSDPRLLIPLNDERPLVNGRIWFHRVESLPEDRFKPGSIDPAAGKATVAYVEAAVGLVRKGAVDAIVGCPHNETAVNAAGIPFSGYPSLIARLTETAEEKVFMMLVGGGLRILHATLHERIHQALARLTPDLIEEAGLVCAATLRRLGVDNPRIGVFGINPHAGGRSLALGRRPGRGACRRGYHPRSQGHRWIRGDLS
jgi:4-hydroxy-L-threonine phosphate dehydrogenase PdxA